MKTFTTCLYVALYTVLGLGANPVFAEHAKREEIRGAKMERFRFHHAPRAVSQKAFKRADDSVGTLGQAYRGKFVLLNFWALWCAPCREEMPTLSRLQTRLGGDAFEVVTIAIGVGVKRKVARFFEEIGVGNLPQFRDRRNGISAEMGVRVLPLTVLISPEGEEIGRLLGEAEWDAPEVEQFLRDVMKAYKGR